MSHRKIKAIITLILICVTYLSVCTINLVHAVDANVGQNGELSLNESLEQNNAVIDLKLNGDNENDVFEFKVDNLLPGDSIYHTYNIKVSCSDDVTVKFHANADESDKLSEVIKAKVMLKETGEVLYNGLITDMPKSLDFKIKTNEHTTKTLQYDIVIYLDTSVGNEYMNCGADVDFEWCVDEVDNLDDPGTGDDTNIILWIVLMVGCVVGVIVLFVRRKEEDEEYED